MELCCCIAAETDRDGIGRETVEKRTGHEESQSVFNPSKLLKKEILAGKIILLHSQLVS